MGGPIWNAAMHDKIFVEAVMQQIKANTADFASEKRLYGLLAALHEELEVCAHEFLALGGWVVMVVCDF